MSGFARRVSGALAATAAAVISLVIVPATPAAADNGLRVEASSSYEARPGEGVVKVAVAINLTNTTVDQPQGNIIRRQFFSGISVPVAAPAAAVTAVSGAEQLAADLVPINEYVARVDVAFPNLFSGQTRSVMLTYDITGTRPRSTGVVRINPAYVSFLAIAVGDPGLGSVRVAVPGGFQAETVGATMRRASEGGSTVFTATGVEQPLRFSALVSARNDTALGRVDADVGARDILIRPWPGDDEWTKFVANQVTAGIPVLEQLIGQPWPLTAQLKVVEAATPYLRGYAGWFAPTTSTIEVGERLDAEIMLHELSHAWFNRELFAERWINEGFADTFAALAHESLGNKADRPDTPNAAEGAKVRLSQWETPIGSPTEVAAIESYGYNASFFVIDQIAREVGTDKMRAVITAARDDVPAYGGEPRELGDLATDTRRLLDLFDNVASSARAGELFKSYVFTDRDAPALAARATARDAYRALADASDGWRAPALVRKPLGEWRFDEANAAIAAANRVVEVRDRIAAGSDRIGAAPSGALRERYETASTDLDAASELAGRQLAVVEHLGRAHDLVHASRNPVQKIGLLFDHPGRRFERGRAAYEADDLDRAQALAAQTERLIDGAQTAGLQRSGLAGVVAAAGGGAALYSRRRARRLPVQPPITPPPESHDES